MVWRVMFINRLKGAFKMTDKTADFTQGSILKKLVAFMMPVLGARSHPPTHSCGTTLSGAG